MKIKDVVKMPELLPCPFCGGEANRSSLFQICYCSNSHCFLYGSAIPITKWNTRHVPPMEISMLSVEELAEIVRRNITTIHIEEWHLTYPKGIILDQSKGSKSWKEICTEIAIDIQKAVYIPTAKPLKEEHPDPCFIEKSHMQSVSMDENDKPVKEELDEKELSNALFDFAWNWIKCSTSNQSLVKELADKKAEELLSKFAVTNKPEVLNEKDVANWFIRHAPWANAETFAKLFCLEFSPAVSRVPSEEEMHEAANQAIGDKIGYFKDEEGVVDIVITAVRALWEGK